MRFLIRLLLPLLLLLALAAFLLRGRLFPQKEAAPDTDPERVLLPYEELAPEEYETYPVLQVIEGCTVTWYTEDTCGKSPSHPAYGITASGLPVAEGVTCAVDPTVIPLFSEVYVEYSDGSVGHFRATDTGVKGRWVDIYTPDYSYAVRCGRQRLTVKFLPPGARTEAYGSEETT